jgi:hypothetical protein
MELVLNLFWFLLGLLTLGLWWRAGAAWGSHYIDRLRKLALLACVLVLLFPVVSATDDLHPLRPEMEECNPSKRLKQVAAQKSSSALGIVGALPAHLSASFSAFPLKDVCGQILSVQVPLPGQAQLGTDACRAPPVPAVS